MGGKKLHQANNVRLVAVTRYGKEINTPSTTNLYKYEIGSKPSRKEKAVKSSDNETSDTENLIQILKIRLAKGEISIDEYNSLKKILENE